MTTQSSKHRLIRPLEGYRALAILAVLIFHLDKNVLPGGYLGVDLFFVISGFIITKGIMKTREAGTFKLSSFYAKRFRRLFPALLVTTIFILVFSYFILSPERFSATGKSSLFSLFSLANINFWMEAGYFDAASTTKPLLHMWSLSVEEQFYLFWPFILVLFTPKNWKFWAISLLVLSFAATVVVAERAPETAFFWFPFRVYEFMGGAILSIIGFQFNNRIVSTFALLFGSVIFVSACLFFDEASNIALTGGVTVLACMLLLSSMESKLADLIFGNSIFVWLGQRSYSIYLVHWPLIVLYIAQYGSLSVLEAITLGLFSILLGMALKWLIEDPFRVSRSSRSLSNIKAYPPLIATTAISVFAASIVWGYRGFPSRIDSDLTSLLERDSRYHSLMRRGTCFMMIDGDLADLPSKCYIPDQKKQNVLLIGSSIAADLNHGLANSLPDWKVSQITRAKCYPFMHSGTDKKCNKVRNYIYNEIIPKHDYDLIVIAGYNAKLDNRINDIELFLDSLNQDYVFIGPRPFFKSSPRDLIAKFGALKGLDNEMQKHLSHPNEAQAVNSSRNYFSTKEIFCAKKNQCLWRNSGKLLYQDNYHLSPSGSIYFGERFVEWLNEREN